MQGLEGAHLLEKFVTTIAIAEDGRSDRSPVQRRLLAVLSRRQVPDLVWRKTDCIWDREVIRIIATRYFGQDVAHNVWRWADEGFDRKVASRYSGRVPIIYGVEHSGRITFSEHKKKGGLCVLRQINGHILDYAKILKSESLMYPDHMTSYQKNNVARVDVMVIPRLQQIEDADLIIGNSRYVYESFRDQGVSEYKLAYVPTGCPKPGDVPARAGSGSGKLRFVYASALSMRKGIARLLDVWEELDLTDHAELHVFGFNEFRPTFLKSVKGISYHGHATGKQVCDALYRSDVFVLPTLSEGRSHAVLEAVSAGLPVITTKESGCEDVVRDRENGLIVERGNADNLKEALIWCVENRRRLQPMGTYSRYLAEQWQVKQANRAHLQMVRMYMEKGRLENWQDSLLH